MKYIIANDMGTSANKSCLFTVKGELIAEVTREYAVHYPAPGCVEQDPKDWWNAITSGTKTVIEENSIHPSEVAGITFAAQMLACLPVDRSGTPLMNCMIWQDQRAAECTEKIIGGFPSISGYGIRRILKFIRITGGAPSKTGKDMMGKVYWQKLNKPEIYDQTYKFLDCKDYLVWKCTDQFVMSVDSASITWFMDSRDRFNPKWSPAICKMVGVDIEKLPEIKKSTDRIGDGLIKEAAAEMGLNPKTPVILGCGDAPALTIGSGAVREQQWHVYLGTSGWVAGHTSKREIDISHYTGCMGSAHPEKYLCIAEQQSAGACLEWFKNQLYFHDELMEREGVAEVYEIFDRLVQQAEPGSKNLLFTPWLFGERAPLDDPNVRGSLFNLSLDHKREHVLRAIFEGVAFNSRWALQTVEKLFSSSPTVNIVGGGAKSSVWCQIMADIINRQIHQVSDPQHAGARGVALVASYGLGFIEDFDQLGAHIPIKQTFTPNPAYRKLYDQLFKEFKTIYKKNKKMYARLNR
ncbi:MAG: FGGY-family carbohydrate kinase [Candidatus Hodarchaeota archaeon]